MKGLIWIVSFIVIGIVFVFVFITNTFFLKGNDAEKYAENYISNSIELIIMVPIKKTKFEMINVSTGIRVIFNQGRMKGRKIATVTFYSEKYKKYFVVYLPGYLNGQYVIYDSLMHGKSVKAKVNLYDFENYGSKESPVPVFWIDIPSTHSDYLKVRMTDEQYRDSVLFYLTYIMQSNEFKKRFKK